MEIKPFAEAKILLYSLPKIGKTTLVAQLPDAIILDTEEGAGYVSAPVKKIRNWMEFCHFVASLKDNNKYRTVVIDTVNSLLRMADAAVSGRRGVMCVGAADDYGKTSSVYFHEVSRQLDAIIHLGVGVWFCCHAEEKTVPVSTLLNPYAPALADNKGNVTMIIPAIDKKVRQYLSSLVDAIWYLNRQATEDGKLERILCTESSSHFEAGGRMPMPPIVPIPLTGAYEVLVKEYGKIAGYKDNLITLVEKGEAYLAEHQIDGFEVQKRVENSRLKHLGTSLIAEAENEKLEAYLAHLRGKARQAKNGINKGENNEPVSRD